MSHSPSEIISPCVAVPHHAAQGYHCEAHQSQQASRQCRANHRASTRKIATTARSHQIISRPLTVNEPFLSRDYPPQLSAAVFLGHHQETFVLACADHHPRRIYSLPNLADQTTNSEERIGHACHFRNPHSGRPSQRAATPNSLLTDAYALLVRSSSNTLKRFSQKSNRSMLRLGQE